MEQKEKRKSPRIKPPKELPPSTLCKIAEYLPSVPEKHRLATERVLRRQVARSTAIRVRCLQCSNYQREEVTACTVVTCALHPFRPYQ